MKYRALIATLALAVVVAAPSIGAFSSTPAVKDPAITGLFDGSPIVARAAKRFGGAIYSLTWRDKEFINSSDNGRELQSASSFDGLGESYNPTEAGNRWDRGRRSTSLVLSLSMTGNTLEGETQMAFWRGGLSQHILKRNITIGFLGIPNVIRHRLTFVVPEAHKSATFEALTGYMPPEFSRFYTYDPAAHTLARLSDGPGEQSLPVILATADGDYAMGVYSPQPNMAKHAGYGRFRFPAQQVVKWNCVFRLADIVPGAYQTECDSIIGSLKDVEAAMAELYAKTSGRLQTASSTGPAPLH